MGLPLLSVFMKKTTLQDIADALDISRTTVWKVFSGQEGVSDNLRNRIIEKAQELGYKNSGSYILSSQPAAREPSLNIAVVVCRPESSIFWMTIIHHIAEELGRHNATLIYTYLPATVDADYAFPHLLTNGSTQGMIVINVYNEKLLRMLAALKLPKVFLDTATGVLPGELNGDLVLMENRSSVSSIVEHLIRQGRRSFGFIGDICYAKSNYERYEGLFRTLTSHDMTLDPALALTALNGERGYKAEIDTFLNGLSHMPEAFICANDHVAYLLVRLLHEKGYQVPSQVAVSGFDANPEYQMIENLTTVQVYNEQIGLRLAAQILFRIQHPDHPHEIIYVGSHVLFRGSTGDAQA